MRHFLLFWLLFSATAVSGQAVLPFTENFSKAEYRGDNQQWGAVQGSDQAMYFANNHFLLRYNGVRWEKYHLPNSTIIRSVFCEGQRIYSGSYKEFGYWTREGGKMKYQSLTAGLNLFRGLSENEEIWKIFKWGKEIVFQSFNELYFYDGQRILKQRLPFQISYAYEIDGQLLLASVRQGIYSLQGSVCRKLEGGGAVEGQIVHHIGSFNDEMYVFTRSRGVFVYKDGQLKPWDFVLNNRLKDEVVMSAKFVGAHSLAIGTGLNGLYLYDMQRGTYRLLNRENGLRNNAVLSLATDREGNLWAGLDNGIAHVEIGASVGLFSDNSGKLGSVYAVAPYKEGYLVGTNHGLFTYIDGSVKPVPGAQGQVWNIYRNGETYVIGHNDGTFTYKGGHLKKENSVTGGWQFMKSDFENVWFQATYSGITSYKNPDDLSEYTLFGRITKPIRYIAQTKPGELWAADNYRSVYQLSYNKDFETLKIRNISEENGLKNDYGVVIFKHQRRVLFLIDSWWYSVSGEGKLVKDPVFNAHFRGISDIAEIDKDRFMIVEDGILYIVSQVGASFERQIIPEKYYSGKIIPGNTAVIHTPVGLLINLDDGFMTYHPVAKSPGSGDVTVEAFYQGKLVGANTDIAYNQPVSFDIVSGYFGQARPELYYKINDPGAYKRVVNGQLALSNLSSGRQQLRLFTYDGNKFKMVTSYDFEVDNPWYFAPWMVILYITVLLVVFRIYYKWNQIRYQQKLELHQEELKHQKRVLELQMQAEKDIQSKQFEKHILEMEVQAKSSEVAVKSLSIAKQSDLIEGIQKILETEQEASQIRRQIRMIIKSNAIDKNEWKHFEDNLLQSHEDFVQKLSQQYPELTARDIKLCIYLRMNMSSKEIAPLMKITFRGVELHRYRLRKKLGIPMETNLNKFMINL